MFKSIEIEKFRGIKYLKVDNFKRINIITGKNNSYKTSLLEAIFLAIAPGNSELPFKISIFRNSKNIDETILKTLFYRLNVIEPIKLKLTLTNTEEILRKISIKPNYERQLSTERMKHKTITEETPNEIKVPPLKESEEISTQKNIKGLITEFEITKTNRDSDIRNSYSFFDQNFYEHFSPPEYVEELNGRYIGASKFLLGDLSGKLSQIIMKKQKDKILNVLKMIDKNISDIQLIQNNIFFDNGYDEYLPINVMGDGINHVLNIICSIATIPNGILIIDELENGLHYSSQSILWEAIISASKEFNVQIFATTHSYECIKNIYEKTENEDIVSFYRLDRLNGDCDAVMYDRDSLRLALMENLEIR